MTRRRWWFALVALAIVVAAGRLVVLYTHPSGSSCGVASVPTGEVPLVFSKPSAPLVTSDPGLQRLVRSMGSLGTVTAAVPYQDTQWLRSAPVPVGFATWTAGNAVVGLRGPDGRARWGLRQSSNAQAWAVVGEDFLNLDLRPHQPVQVASFSSTGQRNWCRDVGEPTKQGDPLAVASGPLGSMWVITAGPTLTHIRDGHVVAQETLRGADRAAFVRQVGGLVIVGGRRADALALSGTAPSSTAVTALDVQTLKPRWSWGAEVAAHVVGISGDTIVLTRSDHGRLSLVGLGLDGHQRWATVLPADTTTDMALHRVVLVRDESQVSAYSLHGELLWSRAVGGFPLGFDLAAQPLMGNRVLIGAHGALVLVDPEAGQAKAIPLLGITPYQATISSESMLLETNVGAVLVALRPHR